MYNELVITNDNKLYLDGSEVILNHIAEEKNISVVDGAISTRALSSVQYSSSPLKGSESGYTKTSGAQRYSLELSNKIASIGTTVLCTILGAALGILWLDF